eukprot:m.584718 g.584718  ORF g.584718 m.584718 type:complete len:187 (+) comp22339_c1_seq66:2290-2850(+)
MGGGVSGGMGMTSLPTTLQQLAVEMHRYRLCCPAALSHPLQRAGGATARRQTPPVLCTCRCHCDHKPPKPWTVWTQCAGRECLQCRVINKIYPYDALLVRPALRHRHSSAAICVQKAAGEASHVSGGTIVRGTDHAFTAPRVTKGKIISSATARWINIAADSKVSKKEKAAIPLRETSLLAKHPLG